MSSVIHRFSMALLWGRGEGAGKKYDSCEIWNKNENKISCHNILKVYGIHFNSIKYF